MWVLDDVATSAGSELRDNDQVTVPVFEGLCLATARGDSGLAGVPRRFR